MQYIDQIGFEVSLEKQPVRIISLVPSQTELLHDLGLEKEVVGITKFCVHPESWFRAKTRVGGTKQLDFEKIRGLNPDLIIGNKEENEQAQIEMLQGSYPVWMSDIKNLPEALIMIEAIGKITGRLEIAKTIANSILVKFDNFGKQIKNTPFRKAAYLIWKNPWMVAGGNTFINDMLQRCHFENVFEGAGRYPEITTEDLKSAGPSLVLLSSEPYPFREKHAAEIQKLLPDSKILPVDGELFSWYGTRLLAAPAYFAQLLRRL
ncbi:MAG TPA: helical backbone metal receptor [Bacteroidia bacterium]|nr:helical backbone metal receptor [Bacteroidia bacterium]